ncbi:MAG: aminoglycoside phosphotransferase [Rubrivivax sp.]|nr:MAG: aminoglycoside phosphotransferase [Rubrivivax sp.]
MPSFPPIVWTDAQRQAAFQAWLTPLAPQHGLLPDTLRSASADASFRRYFRVDAAGGAGPSSFIVMDAPPAKEDCRPFVSVARLLHEGGVNVPQVLAWDEPQGFMLLTDLGEHTLLSTLDVTPAASQPETPVSRARYQAALEELLRLQAVAAPADMPLYDDALLQRELDLFPDWYLTKLRGQTLGEEQQATLAKTFALIKAQVLAQPTALVHRDYHSRNLMVSPDDLHARPGVIDFQDAVVGPVSYDLVSLLRDAYVYWDEEDQLDHAVRHWQRLRKAGMPVAEDFGEFWRDFEWMGLQRHLKVLGIFARLALRDGKQAYLDDIPRVWTYAHKVCTRYQGLGPLAKILEQAEASTMGIQRQVGYTF